MTIIGNVKSMWHGEISANDVSAATGSVALALLEMD
jgi:hypothetical protein